VSGASDIFRQPWKPFKLKEEDDDLPVGYAEHVRGRVVRPSRIRLRPDHARRQHDPVKCAPQMRLRAALGSQEVMVKVISHGRDLDSVRRQLRYVARDGEVPLERSHGEIVEGDRDAIDAVAEEWAIAFRDHKGRARNSIHMVVSAPTGSDRDAVENAAREFAVETFGANWDYALARHDDTPNPHVHIVAETRGMDGTLFSVAPDDIQPMRERFATECWREGLDVTATPRAVRAAPDRDEPIGVVKLRDGGDIPERDVRPQAEADTVRERNAQERLIAHEAKINRALAAELRETGRAEDARAALGLDGLADRADALFDRDTDSGDGDDAAQDAVPQPEEPSLATSGDDEARLAELTSLNHLAALERLAALRKRKYDELRSQFSGLSGKARADALDSLRGYEREMDDAHEEMRALRGSSQVPPEPAEQVRDHDPPEDRSPLRQEKREADREEGERDDDRDDDR